MPAARRRVQLAVGVAVVMAVSACSGDSERHRERAPVALGASFVQQRWHEHTDRADVRVTNLGEDDVVVTGVGVSWPGFPGHDVFASDATFFGGQTIDLAMTLPAPDCTADASAPVMALVETEGRLHTMDVDDAGTRAIRSIWRSECAAARLAAVADLAWGETWRVVSDRGEPKLQGSLELTRRSDASRVAITGLLGSVLLDLEPVHDRRPLLRLATDQDHASLPVALGSNGRCDAHALGGSTQTFLLRVDVQLGRAEPQQITMTPDRRTRAAVLDVVRAACRAG